MADFNFALAGLGAVASFDGSGAVSGHGPTLAIDDSDTTYFERASQFSTAWWQVDLGAPQFITSLRLVQSVSANPQSCAVTASLNGTSWDSIDTFPAVIGSQTITIEGGVTYRYWRLTRGNNSYLLRINTLEVWGPVTAPPPPENPATDYINAWLDGIEANFVPDVQAWLDAN